MILVQGDKVVIVHRRLFADDHARFFVGLVDGYEAGIAKVRGNTWIFDTFSGRLARKNDARTKIFSIASGTLMVYQLASDVELSSLRFETARDDKLVLTDGKGFSADFSESEHVREKTVS
jgi:hypothetical protein